MHLGAKKFEFVTCEITPSRDGGVHRIDLLAMENDFVMQMRSFLSTSRPHVSDNLALLNARAPHHASRQPR